MSEGVSLPTPPEPDHVHIWVPWWFNSGITTSATVFGIDPAPYGHRGYTRYRLVPDPVPTGSVAPTKPTP